MLDLMAGLRASTLSIMHMAEDAEPSLKGMYDHVQCLIDGLSDDLRLSMEAFIKAQSNVFSSSEYDIGHTNILPHHIDSSNNVLHFEQLRRHPTMQLPLIDEHVENML